MTRVPAVVYRTSRDGQTIDVYGPSSFLVHKVILEMIKREQQLYHLTLNTLQEGMDSATEDDQRELTR